MFLMNKVLSFLFCALPVWCGPVSFGVKGGVPLRDALGLGSSDGRDALVSDTQRWTAGATVEFNLPAGLSIGVDALYRRFSFSYAHSYVVTIFSDGSTGHWEFPVYAKYRFGKYLARPFVEAGFAFDRART